MAVGPAFLLISRASDGYAIIFYTYKNIYIYMDSQSRTSYEGRILIPESSLDPSVTEILCRISCSRLYRFR